MKPLILTLITIGLLTVGFIGGIFFSDFSSKQKLTVDKERFDFLIELHKFQRSNSRKAYNESDTIISKIFPLITDGTLTSKGKISNDPIKKLLWESYHCINGNMGVIRNYDQQVYVEDSAFLKAYFKPEDIK